MTNSNQSKNSVPLYKIVLQVQEWPGLQSKFQSDPGNSVRTWLIYTSTAGLASYTTEKNKNSLRNMISITNFGHKIQI